MLGHTGKRIFLRKQSRTLFSGLLLLAILSALTVSLVGAGAAQAADLEIRGKLSYDLAYGLESESISQHGLAYEINVEREFGFDGKVHVGWRGAWTDHPATEAGLSLDLDEAYADLYLDAVDLRVGRQIVNWGTADGFNPTNVINPRGPLSLSPDELSGLPLLAVQAAYYLPSGASLTGVVVTEFVPAADALITLNAIADEIETQLPAMPRLSFERTGPEPVPADFSQMAFALRGETMLANHNVYVSYYNGWEDRPAAWLELSPTPGGPLPTGVVAQYRKVQKLGVATAGTVGGAGIWSELSYAMPERLGALDSPGALSSNDSYLEAVVGGDYTFSNGLTASAQVVYDGGGSLLNPYKDPYGAVQPQTYLASMLRYSPTAGHDLEGVGLINLSGGGALTFIRYTYAFTQGTSLSIGLSKVFADAGSEFDTIKAHVDTFTAGLSVSF